ncbi:RES family NAD+ phosphorylase [Verminephrobacter aporrectodeae]|uniref:RES domain-containing protein n=1 Tax=Verminephrobacter aporrectodeae subsp. tuberculatae TaxID=1110392 RepID=A0ABT3KX25_9BURK|nr:RES family NAD+ phosphorylase [Verminephrobacter aporrectodeae]MCW5221660.1 RES domain-containing protein [Verminephrobacter aporrectodeae subsp. tuberculatae]MCW5257974.1 RES domain-containing protein [Verminephrobacter aporrectodeae subsp. tuberculatae]MCW5290950.1 RES domain-containing protein [Verminephrobacter aporrectodeae subsp. tuberculatae]MCW5322890.1 RES domain-containing protein [Verminephrobacter aporrectodeae subsp. tuberculatae]MCW8176129.1 RES domain-containing protein [Verm
MTTVLWRIATDTKEYKAHDLSGKGAQKTGGRWNRPGRPVVYTSLTVALACLETVVHLDASDLPMHRFLVRIEVPDQLWEARRRLMPADLPPGWNATPEGKASLDVGDTWLATASTTLLTVPSVIVPEEYNVLINPLHANAAAIKAIKERPWFYDQRLLA